MRLTLLEPKIRGLAGGHISGRAQVPTIQERNPNARHRASARRLAGEHLLTIHPLRDIDSRAVESGVRGGFEHRRAPSRRVSASPVKAGFD